MAKQAGKPIIGVGVLCRETKPSFDWGHCAKRIVLASRIRTRPIQIDQRKPLEEGKFGASKILLRFDVKCVPLHITSDSLDRDIVIAPSKSSHKFKKPCPRKSEDLIHVE